jgi:hypothetical protein
MDVDCPTWPPPTSPLPHLLPIIGFNKLGPGTNPQVEKEWEEEQKRKQLEKEEEKTRLHAR